MENNILDRFTYAIDQLGLRHVEVAKTMGISASTLCRILNGSKRLTEYYIELLLEAFPRLSADFIYKGEGFVGFVSIKAVQGFYEARLKERDETIRVLQEQVSLLQKMLEEKM